MHKVLGRRCD